MSIDSLKLFPNVSVPDDFPPDLKTLVKIPEDKIKNFIEIYEKTQSIMPGYIPSDLIAKFQISETDLIDASTAFSAILQALLIVKDVTIPDVLSDLKKLHCSAVEITKMQNVLTFFNTKPLVQRYSKVSTIASSISDRLNPRWRSINVTFDRAIINEGTNIVSEIPIVNLKIITSIDNKKNTVRYQMLLKEFQTFVKILQKYSSEADRIFDNQQSNINKKI